MTREQAQCLLGVSPDATLKDVVRAHRRLVSTVHPDKCSGPEANRLARQATAAREVLLAPAQGPPHSSSPPAFEALADDVLLQYVRLIVDRMGGPVDGVVLFRIFCSELRARGLSDDAASVGSVRVLDDDFLAAGAARGYWDLHGDGVRPVRPAGEPAGSWSARWREPGRRRAASGRPAACDAHAPEPQADLLVEEEELGLWVQAVVRWAGAVAAAGMFWLGPVGCAGVVVGALADGELFMVAFAVPLVFVCTSAAVWLMRCFGLARSALKWPLVWVPGLLLSVVLFFLLAG